MLPDATGAEKAHAGDVSCDTFCFVRFSLREGYAHPRLTATASSYVLQLLLQILLGYREEKRTESERTRRTGR